MGFSQNRFSYGGFGYQVDLKLVSGDESIQSPLDFSKIGCLEYMTEFNNLVMEGTVTYDDSYGVIDNFLERQETRLQIHIIKIKEEEGKNNDLDKTPDNETIDPDTTLHMMCLVRGIELLKREGNSVSYKISFVSGNIYRCMANIDYSNWQQGPMDVFQIMRACFQKVGLECDKQTFDSVKTGVQFNYITNGNDNAFSVVQYLMSRLYYFAEKDDSLKFMFWNHIKQQYQLFDMKDSNTYNGISEILLSFSRRNSETMTQPEPQQIGTIIDCPMDMAMLALSNIKMCEYDSAENSLSMKETSNEEVVSFMSNRSPQQNNVKRKFFPHISKPNDVNYVRRGTYWGQCLDLYWDLQECMLKSNQLVVETKGDIERVPGCQVNVKVERDTDATTTESHQELQKAMNRFRGIEGLWFASRVRTYIYPNGDAKFRQFMSLTRNFTVNIDPAEPAINEESTTEYQF